MDETKIKSRWYVDLTGVLLSASAISYLSYLGLRDSMTGEIKNVKVLVASLVLHYGSYLLSYIFLFKRNDFLRIPNWVLIAVMGSILCSITFRVPVNMISLEGIVGRAFFFSVIACGLMGFVRLIYWLVKSNILGTSGV